MSETKIHFLDAFCNGRGYTKIHLDHAALGVLEVSIVEDISRDPNIPIITVYNYPTSDPLIGGVIANPPSEVFDATRVAFARNWEAFMTKHPEHPKAGELREVIALI